MLCGTTKKEPSELLEHEHNYIDGKCSCGAEEEKKYYMLSFDTDGGSIIETVLLYSGDTIIAPANPIKEGYTFQGWSTSSSGVTVNYQNGATIKNLKDGVQTYPMLCQKVMLK